MANIDGPKTTLYTLYWNGKKSYPLEHNLDKTFPWVQEDGRIFKLRDTVFQEAYERGDVHAVKVLGAMVPPNKKKFFTNLVIDKRFSNVSILDYANDEITQLLVSEFNIPIGGVRIPITVRRGYRY